MKTVRVLVLLAVVVVVFAFLLRPSDPPYHGVCMTYDGQYPYDLCGSPKP